VTVRLAIALQGGGSHGAFTWGVLDRLLQEPRLEIVAISGTSAGAMNAGILADGLRRGGAAQARKALENYWKDVGRLPGYAGFPPPALPGAPRTWNLERNPVFLWHEMLTRIWSPYETNPFNYNPLRTLLERIDFDGLRRDPRAARVFICATNVRTGSRRVFENEELSADVLLASAALPQVYQAVELGHLRQIGTRAAERWLAEHRQAVGKHSTVDLSRFVPTRHGSLIGQPIIERLLELET